MERISTGNPELDQILGGGLPKHSINVLMGLPGSGKSILAEQIAFANASRERPALYLATLSEPLPKLITYLQELSFADTRRLGTEVLYESLVEALQHDTPRLSKHIQALIQQHRPQLIIIDSFKAIADLLPASEWRRAVFDLAELLTAYDVTSVWVGEYNTDAATMGLVEFAVADGIIELRREQTGSRDDRYLRVAKLRGSAFQDGSHAFTIARDGLRVFPRLVTPAYAVPYQPLPERLQTGISGLDDMIERGCLRGTSTLLAGPSGAGKTVVGLHFLKHGAMNGEAGLLVNFQENPTQIGRTMEGFGWDVEALMSTGNFDILYTSPVELHIDTIAAELLRRVEQRGVKRIVIDALGDIERSARDPERFMDYLYAMNQMFSARNITAMLVLEVIPATNRWYIEEGHQVSYISDNIVSLSMELTQELTRTIRILKSRGSAHDERRHELHITPHGVVIQ